MTESVLGNLVIYAFVLMKCPFDRQCFAFAGHWDWQCRKSFRHGGIDGRNYKFPQFQYLPQILLNTTSDYFLMTSGLNTGKTNKVSVKYYSRDMSKHKTTR